MGRALETSIHESGVNKDNRLDSRYLRCLIFIPVPASEYGVNTLLRFIHMISLASDRANRTAQQPSGAAPC
jgi:hypothetical protein